MFIALYQKVGPIFHLINWNLHMIFINFVRIYVWGNTCSFSPLKLYVSILSHQLIQRDNTNLVQFGDKLGLSFLQVSEFKIHFITPVPCVHGLTKNSKTTELRPFTAA